VLRGDEKVAVEDVRGIGAAISVQFNGDNNMFRVLDRKARGEEGGAA